MTLYSYVIPVDDGAAPNPFWGTCTLVICKPKIRRTARVGDWIAATGSKHAPGRRDLGRRLVYAMRVTTSMTMREYDEHVRSSLPEKLPDVGSQDWRRRVGDCLYDFSGTRVRTRPGRHPPSFKSLDLGGKNALLSTDFYYFGADPVELPEELLPIVKQGNGHRASANDAHEEKFVRWVRTLSPGLQGEPQIFPWGR